MHRSSALFLLPAALLLGACGQMSTPTGTTSNEMVQLTLKAAIGPRLQAQGVGPQGLPSDPAGLPVVNLVKVKVYKHSDGTPVSFDENNLYSATGTRAYLKLSPSSNSITVLLPAGQYDIENIGKVEDGQGGSTFFAYGRNDNVSLLGSNPTKGLRVARPTESMNVTLDLHTLSSESMSSFRSFLPVSVVTTSQKMDLRLAVRSVGIAQNNTGASIAREIILPTTLPVPGNDFQVVYSFDGVVGGTLSTQSKYGANVVTPASLTGSTFTVNATVTGWVQTGDEKAALQSFTKTYSVPFAALSSLSSDLTPPSVTVNGDNGLGGTASDNLSIASLRVFEGSSLVASTDGAEQNADVSSVSFSGNNWSVSRTFDDATSYDITAIATDAAGNESRATGTFTGAELNHPVATLFDYNNGYYCNCSDYYSYLYPAPGSDAWYRIDLTKLSPNYTLELRSYNYYYYGNTVTFSLHTSVNGPEVVMNPMNWGGGWDARNIVRTNDQSRVLYVHVQRIGGYYSGEFSVYAYNN